MTNFNERAKTLLYKNISLTLYSRKGWCWLCVRGELETGTDSYILTQSSCDHSSTSFSSSLGCSTVGHWGPQSPQSARCSHVDILSPINSNCNWNWPKLYVAPGYIFVSTFTCFRCSSAYLLRCISWLMAQSKVNMLQYQPYKKYICIEHMHD